MRKVKKKNLMIIIPILVAIGITLIVLIYNGILSFNDFSASKYPVRGVDVSTYQGEIDWPVLAEQNIQFAFIKATEGSGFVDPHFEKNYANAINTDLKIGAYHFFSFDSPGETQADNYISVVPLNNDTLPPVIDVEFYGDKANNLPDKDEVVKELSDFMNNVENHYGKKPIIYATNKSYSLYIAGNFDEYDIWIRNIISHPSLTGNRNWTFWQYSNREILNGYSGEEKYIDMNVFSGTQDDFDNYG